MSGAGSRLAARIARSITGGKQGAAGAAATEVAGGAGRSVGGKGAVAVAAAAAAKTSTPTAKRPPPSEYHKWRSAITSVLFAAVIATGAIWGASLKSRSQAEEAKQKAEQATADETIAILEQRRDNLARLKLQLEEKLADRQAQRGVGKLTPEQFREKEKNKPQARPLNIFKGSQ